MPTKRKKLGRNAKCHCGSLKKYKKCCLDEDESNFNRNMLDDQFVKIVKYIKTKHNKTVEDVTKDLTLSNYKTFSDRTVHDPNLVLVSKKKGCNRDLFTVLIENNNKNPKARYYICHNDGYLLLEKFSPEDIDKAFPIEEIVEDNEANLEEFGEDYEELLEIDDFGE